MLLPLAALAIAVLGGAAPPARAVPLYTATAGGCASDGVANSPVPVTASTNQGQCTAPSFYGYGGSFASSSQNGLGASADWTTFCCGSSTGGGGIASIDTEFMIVGPAGPVTISLNLELTGMVGGGTVTGFSERVISTTVIIAGVNWYTGTLSEQSSGVTGIKVTRTGSLAMPGTNCSTPCSLSTTDVLVNANTLVPLHMSLSTGVSGIGDGHGVASAANTLYFPKEGPVFNLPDGYTAVIYGMNVEDNRVLGEPDSGGAVPEPGTWALVGGGLALAASWRLIRYR